MRGKNRCKGCGSTGAYLGLSGDPECVNRECYYYSQSWEEDSREGQTPAPSDLSSQGPHDEATEETQEQLFPITFTVECETAEEAKMLHDFLQSVGEPKDSSVTVFDTGEVSEPKVKSLGNGYYVVEYCTQNTRQ